MTATKALGAFFCAKSRELFGVRSTRSQSQEHCPGQGGAQANCRRSSLNAPLVRHTFLAVPIFAIALFATGLVDIPGRELRLLGIAPVDLSVVRVLTSGLLFLVCAAIRMIFCARPRIDRSGWRAILSFALLGVVATNCGTTFSVSVLPASTAVTTIFATSIATTLLFSDRTAARMTVDICIGMMLVVLVACLLGSNVADFKNIADPTVFAVPILTGIAQGLLYKVLGASDVEPFSFYGLSFAIGAVISLAVVLLAGLATPESVVHAINASVDEPGNLLLLAGAFTVVPYIAARLIARSLTMFAKGTASVGEPMGGVVSDMFNGHDIRFDQAVVFCAVIVVVIAHQVYTHSRAFTGLGGNRRSSI